MRDWNVDRPDAADRVIDRAVREIMSAEPRPGFRYRVLARLDETPRSSWTWTRVAVSAVGALAIVVAIVVTRQSNRQPQGPQVADGPPVSVSTPPTVSSPRPTEPRRAPAPAVAANARSSRPFDRAPTGSEPRLVRAASLTPDLSATEGGTERSGIEATVVIEPISISPLSVAPLVPPLVTVRPLPTLDRISISPLSTPR